MAKAVKRTKVRSISKANGLLSGRQFDAAYRLASFGYTMDLGRQVAEADYLEAKALVFEKKANAKMTMATSKQMLAEAEKVSAGIQVTEETKEEELA